MRLEHTLVIDAPTALVWDLTMDVTRWPELTPTMQRIDLLDAGPLRLGSQARIKQPAQNAAIWTVTELEPGKRFVWQTRRLGLTLIGAHILEDLDGKCRNTVSIEVAGPGAGLFGLLLGTAIRRSLALENKGFQERAEQRAQNATTQES